MKQCAKKVGLLNAPKTPNLKLVVDNSPKEKIKTAPKTMGCRYIECLLDNYYERL